MKKIAIYGAGGLGREVACLLGRINEAEPQWELIGFFDDNADLKGRMVSHFAPCLGGLDDLNGFKEEIAVVLTIGSPVSLKKVASAILNPLVSFPNIVSPDFLIVDPPTFRIGKGNIILGRCTASCDVSVGDFNLFNGSDVMGHDVKVGSFNSFMPNIRISGEVTIGDGNYFGVGSIILQGLKVGNNVRLGAGAVLMTNPRDGQLYLGNPAKKTVF